MGDVNGILDKYSSKLNLVTDCCVMSWEISLNWLPLYLTADKST